MNSSPYTKFLDPEKVMFQTGLSQGQVVADLGAGAGFYAIASAKIVGAGGSVFVVDILENALNNVASQSRIQGLQNIKTIRADLESQTLSQIPSGSVDLVIMGNLLHQLKNRTNVMKEAFRVLKTGGKLLIVDWNDNPSPSGPAATDRIAQAEAVKLGSAAVFKLVRQLEADRFHYGVLMEK